MTTRKQPLSPTITTEYLNKKWAGTCRGSNGAGCLCHTIPRFYDDPFLSQEGENSFDEVRNAAL